jgi:hypothetical protein
MAKREKRLEAPAVEPLVADGRSFNNGAGIRLAYGKLKGQ